MPLPFKRALAAAALVAALAAPTLVAPAYAAPPPAHGSFSLTFDFGNGGGPPPPPPPPPDRSCMTKSQIVRALNSNGYNTAQVIKGLGRNLVLAVGRKAGKWYQMRIDTCSGYVDQVHRIRRNKDLSFEFYLDEPVDELVCLVTYYDERSAAREDEDEVQSAELMMRSEAEDIDRPRDRRVIIVEDSPHDTRQTCNYLDSINN